MIVIPMAGLSSRFLKAGYAEPKWKLPLCGRPLLDWSLRSFEAVFDRETMVIVHLDSPGVGDFIRERLSILGVYDARLVPLAAPTRGQAETVERALHAIDPEGRQPLTIFNIDTIRPGFECLPIFEQCDGWLECFIGEGDHWSFVRPAMGEGRRAKEVTEKRRISDYCCTGMYYFRKGHSFLEAYAQEEAAPTSSELYVAPLYQRLIAQGLDVRFDVIDPKAVLFSGTPAEYSHLIEKDQDLANIFERRGKSPPALAD
jgi:hypothetical protein